MDVNGVLSSRFAVFAQIAVTTALAVWLVSLVDRSAVDVVRRINPWVMTFAAALMVSGQVWGGLRLAVILRGRGALHAGHAVSMTFVGYFFANFLPGTVGGDVVRTLRLKASGVTFAQAAGALVLDRLVNTAMIVLVALMAVAPATTRLNGGPEGVLLVLGALAAAGGGAIAWVAARSGRLPAMAAVLRDAAAPWLALVRSPSRMVLVAVLTVLTIGASIVAQWLVARELALPIGLVAFAGLACLVTLAGLVPVSLNGIGLQEAGYVILLGQLGAEQSAAVAFAVIVRLLILLTSLVGGAIVLVESIDRLKRAPRH
jgi:uncharacterized membrane protein YbhN (UPF0104 family)